jgi:hypothetical protein
MTGIDEKNAGPPTVTLWHRVWPLAGLAIALILNPAWIGFLGYAMAKAALGSSSGGLATLIADGPCPHRG